MKTHLHQPALFPRSHSKEYRFCACTCNSDHNLPGDYHRYKIVRDWFHGTVKWAAQVVTNTRFRRSVRWRDRQWEQLRRKETNIDTWSHIAGKFAKTHPNNDYKCWAGTVLLGGKRRNGMARRFSHPVSPPKGHDRFPKHSSVDSHIQHHFWAYYIVRLTDSWPFFFCFDDVRRFRVFKFFQLFIQFYSISIVECSYLHIFVP